MSFLKKLFAKKEKKLTVEHVLHVLKNAADHNVDERLRRTTRDESDFYTFKIEDGFKITAFNLKSRFVHQSLEVELREEEHRLIPYRYSGHKVLEEPETIINWKHEGPWVTIVEEQIQALEKAYLHKIKEEKQIIQQILPKVNLLVTELKLPFFEIREKMKEGEAEGIVNAERNVLTIDDETIEQFVYKFDHLKIRLRYNEHGYVQAKLTLDIEGEEKIILFEKKEYSIRKPLQLKGVAASVMDYYLHKIAEDVEQEQMNKKKESSDHFTNKYRLKTF